MDNGVALALYHSLGFVRAGCARISEDCRRRHGGVDREVRRRPREVGGVVAAGTAPLGSPWREGGHVGLPAPAMRGGGRRGAAPCFL